MPQKLSQPIELSVGETEVVSINMTRHLDSSELLSGSPSVSEIRTGVVVPSSPFVNTATYVEAKTGDEIAIGKALQFTVQPTAKGKYVIEFTVTTDSTPARTIIREVDVTIF